MLKEQHPVKKLLRLFEVKSSSYYDRQKETAPCVDKYKALRVAVTEKFSLSGGSAGQRTLLDLLSADEIHSTRYLVRKIMQEEGLISRQPPKHSYPKGGKADGTSPNLLQRRFNATITNRWWCGDVTYIWTQEGWCYLATVMDLMSRRIVGFSLSKNPDSELTIKAFNRAFEARGRPENLVFHSDQGCHYTSHSFRHTLKASGVIQSMSRRGNCWDNAPMERFFRAYKTERMPRLGYENFNDAVADVSHYIDYYYNAIRPHSHNNGLSPVTAEKALAVNETQRVAA